ncbi:MAG TPA: MFS transporter [Anaerolineales bacterium]|nr:MFS transporter [Anaerolineales bacterium]
MAEKGYRLYGYRWVVLAVFMFINLTMQILWISYAPITTPAAQFYGVSDAQIGLLAELFMIAFVPLSLPISWAIDTYGIHRAVGLGAVLMAIFGMLRGLAGSYPLILWSTVGLAVAQPFLLNSWTKVPAQWFGIEERATMVGLVTLSNLLGIAIGEAVPPILLQGGMSIQREQLIFGSIAAFSSLLFLIFAREKPATPPCPAGQETRALMLDGLKHALTIRDFWFFLFVAFIGLAIFNGVSTWVEDIIRPRGFTPTDAGTLGALMVVGGIIGAVVMPSFSDKQRKRVRYLVIGFVLAIPGLLGITYATNYWLLMLSGFWLGFFLISTSPVGFQYAAEITQPTPEGTSNGLIQLFGQASVVYVSIMVALKTTGGSFTPSLLLAIGLILISLSLIAQMKDPVFSRG